MESVGNFVYPLLLIVVFLGLMVGVGTVFSYFWLKHVDVGFRKCPNCEKRGAGVIVDTTKINSQTKIDYAKNPPLRVTVAVFEDHYECEACSHLWKRTFRETTHSKQKAPKVTR